MFNENEKKKITEYPRCKFCGGPTYFTTVENSRGDRIAFTCAKCKKTSYMAIEDIDLKIIHPACEFCGFPTYMNIDNGDSNLICSRCGKIQTSSKNQTLEDLIKAISKNDPFWETLLKKFLDRLSDKSESDKAEFLNKIIKKDDLANGFLKEVNNCNDVNALFDKYNISELGTLRKYKVDENGHMYEEEVKISLPDPMDKAKIYMGVCKLLDITMPELSSNTKRIDESNATYYYNLNRGGKQVIVSDDGTYLAAGSATNYERLLEEFNSGRRNGSFMEDNSNYSVEKKNLICPVCSGILTYMMPDGKKLYCPKCNKYYINDNGTVGAETSDPYQNKNVLY